MHVITVGCISEEMFILAINIAAGAPGGDTWGQQYEMHTITHLTRGL